jgi:hypothetical protein
VIQFSGRPRRRRHSGRAVIYRAVGLAGSATAAGLVAVLVHNHVADEPWSGVDDAGIHRLVVLAGSRRTPLRIREAGEDPAGGPEIVLALHQVVLRAVHGPETIGQQRVGNLVGSGAQERLAGDVVALGVFLGRVVFSDLDLLQDEPHVACIERESLAGRRCGDRGRQHGRDNPGAEQKGEGSGRDFAADPRCLPSQGEVAFPPSDFAMFRHDVLPPSSPTGSPLNVVARFTGWPQHRLDAFGNSWDLWAGGDLGAEEGDLLFRVLGGTWARSGSQEVARPRDRRPG